jgi:transcriptional regulator of met regulon
MLIIKSRLATYAEHAKVSHVINEVTTCQDYKVVNIIHNPHTTNHIILMSTFERSAEASSISEGVTEIRINIHLVREIT